MHGNWIVQSFPSFRGKRAKVSGYQTKREIRCCEFSFVCQKCFGMNESRIESNLSGERLAATRDFSLKSRGRHNFGAEINRRKAVTSSTSEWNGWRGFSGSYESLKLTANGGVLTQVRIPPNFAGFTLHFQGICVSFREGKSKSIFQIVLQLLLLLQSLELTSKALEKCFSNLVVPWGKCC